MRLFHWKKCWIALLVFAGFGCLIWWQRTPVLAWHYTKQLAQANEANRGDWLDRVVGLDVAVVPRLLGYVDDADPIASENAGAALALLAEKWGADDDRAARLLDDVLLRWGGFGPTARQSALQIPVGLLRGSPAELLPAEITLAIGSLLTKATEEPAHRNRTLMLAGLFVERVAPGQWFELCRDLALRGLADADPNNRTQAIRLALHTAKRSDMRFLEKVTPLLRDPLPGVRRAAVVALGPLVEVVSDDELLPMLHDADSEVRRVSELALRGRGLSENNILMARLMSAPQARDRLQVVHHLDEDAELNIGVWLDRLSRDPSPAVRAAALRAAMSQSRADLRPRILQMAQQDGSPTVRQLALYYLQK